MPRNKIYAIVEGHGEVEAVATLINKMLHELNCWTLFTNRKRMFRFRSGGDFKKGTKLEDRIRTYKFVDDCVAILVLFDTDDKCPKTEALAITKRIQAMESLPFSVAVVCPHHEYEAWFLAGLESIHQGHEYLEDPEARRDAKGWLINQFGYAPMSDQVTYTKNLNFELAKARSRSFRRLFHAFEEIIEANEQNQAVVTPIALQGDQNGTNYNETGN